MDKTIIEKYLDERLTQMEKNAFIANLEKDEEFDAWMRLGVENTDDTMPIKCKRQLLRKIVDAPYVSSKSFWVRSARWAWAACIMAIIGMISTWCYYYIKPSVVEEITTNCLTVNTNMGEHSHVILPDGTEVILNSCSEIQYFQQDGMRQANVNGEAYFLVAKDEKHPFVVHADTVDVTCLGTAYDVRNYQDEKECSIVLAEGKVRVSALDADLTMEPNSRVVYDREGGSMSKHMVNASDYTCWINGNIRYNDQTLEEIANQLARDFHINVIIASDELRRERFTGFLGNCSFRNVLDILTITSDIAYHIDENRTVYVYTKTN